MNLIKKRDEHYMKLALMEAKKAYEEEEIPIGAIIVHKNKIIDEDVFGCDSFPVIFIVNVAFEKYGVY